MRGEGTSYAYLPGSRYADGNEPLLNEVEHELRRSGIDIVRGGTWTTDAPFRETGSAIAAAAAEGLKAIEMESAGLYAFARARQRPVVCFAMVTNQMAQSDGDFEKGPDDGAAHALSLLAAAARAWSRLGQSQPRAYDGRRSAARKEQ